MKSSPKDLYHTSRILYIIEAALEHFINLLITGAYFAQLTSAVGMSDSLTGILTALVSLGCGFQIFAIFLSRQGSVKRRVTVLHTLNQFCFAVVYLIPFIGLSSGWKNGLFILFLLCGHVVNNIVNSPKINWYMRLVPEDQKGRFTANKEIISLIGGTVFTLCMGFLIDWFKAAGRQQTAFVICGITLFGLAVLHTATLIGSKEKPAEKGETEPVKKILMETVKDRSLWKAIWVMVLWNIAYYASSPFYGTYCIKELGFSMIFVSGLAAVASFCRAFISRPMGKFADRHSFTNALKICFGIAVVAYTVNVFAVPANGKILYAVYEILLSVSMAGISSGSINLIYEYAEPKKRVIAFALKNAVAGLAGFLSTLVVSRLVQFIQASGNQFLGLHVYAQQVVSVIGAVLVLVTLLYLHFALGKKKPPQGLDKPSADNYNSNESPEASVVADAGSGIS